MSSTPDLKQELSQIIHQLQGQSSVVLGLSYAEDLRARLQRATVTEPGPTDQELLDGLRAKLGKGWRVEASIYQESSGYAQTVTAIDCARTHSHFRMSQLRVPNGIRDVAAALRVLAGLPSED